AHARLRLFAIQAGSLAVLLGGAALILLQFSAKSVHKTSVTATRAAAAPTPQAEATAPVVPAATDPRPNVGELLLHVVDAQSGASFWTNKMVRSPRRGSCSASRVRFPCDRANDRP